MSKRAKVIGAVALGTAAVLGFVVVQTAGKSSVNDEPAVAQGDYAGVVSEPVVVNCPAGAATGTADVQVQAARSDSNTTRDLAPGQRIVVTWGSDRQTTLTRFDRTAAAGGQFLCPAAGSTTPISFSFQLFSGSRAIGSPYVVNTVLQPVAPPS